MEGDATWCHCRGALRIAAVGADDAQVHSSRQGRKLCAPRLSRCSALGRGPSVGRDQSDQRGRKRTGRAWVRAAPKV